MQCIADGEKLSKHFCNLESQNFISKQISRIDLSSDQTLLNQEDIFMEMILLWFYCTRKEKMKKMKSNHLQK